MNALAAIYRKLVPEKTRYRVLKWRTARKLEAIKTRILDFYKKHPSGDAEINEGLNFLRRHPLAVFPYKFSEKYKPDAIEVFLDAAAELHYVLFSGHKLYFRKGLKKEQIQHAYSFLLCEQDPDSPHRYLVQEFDLAQDSVLADVGCAEGIFSLMNIDRVKKVVLFEADPEWLKALEYTFKPWQQKVVLVNKFVSDKSDGQFVSLDDYFKSEKPDFLKIDVDGAEEELLRGAEKLITQNKLMIALCTYHKQQDAEKFEKLLREKNYGTTFSKNYMLFYFDQDFQAPFFRKALLRASN